MMSPKFLVEPRLLNDNQYQPPVDFTRWNHIQITRVYFLVKV